MRTTDLACVRCYTKAPSTKGLEDRRNVLFTVLKAWKPQIKALAEWMPMDGFLVPNGGGCPRSPSLGGRGKEGTYLETLERH